MGPGTETQRVPTPGRALIETESDEVTSDRVWVRRSPIGYLCIGLGPSGKLARFAFEDVASSHPFYDACRRHERDVRREGLAKACRLGLDIPFGTFADPALRRLAIASALLKAGFDPGEARDDYGKWTTDGAGGAAAARTSQSLAAEESLFGPLSAVTRLGLARIALGLSGVTTVLGMIFVPTNRSLITEGTVPDHPDIKFKYDEGEGTLTVHRDGADGSTYGFSAKPDRDGVFRDDQGRAFARRLADGTIVIDPDALPGPRIDSANTNQPKLCPDPSADRPRGLHGPDGKIDPAKIDNAARYQRYVSEVVNGKENALEIGLGVALTDPATGNDVVFDECRRSDGTMIDAKSGSLSMMENTDYPQAWQGTLKKWTGDAERQVRAAGDREIEWHFSEKKVADFMATYFGGMNIPIKIIYTPAPPGLLKAGARTDVWPGSWRVGATQQMHDYA